jgi:hypothetical protein
MASTNEFKLWSEDYVPGIMESWQNKEFVYSGLFMEKTIEGDELQFDFRGTAEMQSLQDEFIDHDHQVLDYEAVKGKAAPFYIAHRWRRADIDRMRGSADNPIPGAVQEHLNAYKRKKSQIFRDAATADVTARYFGETTFSNKSLDTDHQIGTGVAITVDNIRTISSIFERRFALQNGEKPYLAVSREEKDTLLQIEELINKDYNLGAAPTITGEFGNMVEGVQLVLDQDLNTSGGARTCIGWLPSAMAYMNQRSPIVRMDEMQDSHYYPQAYMSIDEGALRVRKFGVVALSTAATYSFTNPV